MKLRARTLSVSAGVAPLKKPCPVLQGLETLSSGGTPRRNAQWSRRSSSHRSWSEVNYPGLLEAGTAARGEVHARGAGRCSRRLEPAAGPAWQNMISGESRYGPIWASRRRERASSSTRPERRTPAGDAKLRAAGVGPGRLRLVSRDRVGRGLMGSGRRVSRGRPPRQWKKGSDGMTISRDIRTHCGSRGC